MLLWSGCICMLGVDWGIGMVLITMVCRSLLLGFKDLTQVFCSIRALVLPEARAWQPVYSQHVKYWFQDVYWCWNFHSFPMCPHFFFGFSNTSTVWIFKRQLFFLITLAVCGPRPIICMSNLDVTVGQKSSKKSLKERQPARQWIKACSITGK